MTTKTALPHHPAKARSKATPAAASAIAVDSRKSPARWGYEVQNKEEQSALKRLAILRTAARLFNERGFYATSLNDLATLLNVTKPSLYYYVKSKDDILLQILHHAMGQIEPAITLAEETGSNGLEKLRIFVGSYVQVLTGDFGKCLVLSGTTPLDPDSRSQVAPAFRRIDQAVRGMIAAGIDDGSIAACDPKLAAFSLFGTLHWMTSWFRADGELSADDVGERLFAIFREGLAPRRRKTAQR
jgi:AcrR family transcriptional regulator